MMGNRPGNWPKEFSLSRVSRRTCTRTIAPGISCTDSVGNLKILFGHAMIRRPPAHPSKDESQGINIGFVAAEDGKYMFPFRPVVSLQNVSNVFLLLQRFYVL